MESSFVFNQLVYEPDTSIDDNGVRIGRLSDHEIAWSREGDHRAVQCQVTVRELAQVAQHRGLGPVRVEHRMGQQLVVAEHLRATNGVHGTVADRREDDREGSLTFRAPGYSADAFIDVATGHYKLATSYQGAIGVINDLHRGRDAGSAWAWLIDVAGVFLVFLSLTGLGLLFYLKKVRLKALVVMAAGAALLVALAKLAT